MKSVFLLEAFSLACFVLLSQVTAKVRLMLAGLASVREKIIIKLTKLVNLTISSSL